LTTNTQLQVLNFLKLVDIDPCLYTKLFSIRVAYYCYRHKDPQNYILKCHCVNTHTTQYIIKPVYNYRKSTFINLIKSSTINILWRVNNTTNRPINIVSYAQYKFPR